MYGFPPLVTMDDRYEKIFINTEDESLLFKTYTVIINYYVETDERVQEPPINHYMTPFDIIVAPISLYAPDNQGPTIEGFIDNIVIQANNKTSFNFGLPKDIEEDPWYVANYTFTERGKLIKKQIEWVSFANDTNLTSLDFTFEPPESAKGIMYELQINFRDNDQEEPAESSFKAKVYVVDDPFIPQYDDKSNRREEVIPVFTDTREIDVTVKSPTNSGLLKIELSEDILMLTSALQWTSENEGKNNLRIDYLPNDKSLELFEDYEINMVLEWHVVGIDQV